MAQDNENDGTLMMTAYAGGRIGDYDLEPNTPRADHFWRMAAGYPIEFDQGVVKVFADSYNARFEAVRQKQGTVEATRRVRAHVR